MTEQDRLVSEIVDWYYNSSEQVFEYSGPAGTGKSFVMNRVVETLRLTDFEIAPMAYVGAAAIVMRVKGLRTAKTIHSTIYEAVKVPDYTDIDPVLGIPRKKLIFRPREHLPGIKLILIDEGSQVPLQMKEDILRFGIKTIVCGDLNQLPPVASTPAFLTGDRVFMLSELWRQEAESGIVYLAHKILNGETLQPGSYGNAFVMTSDWLTDDMLKWSDIILTGRNSTREHFNRYIRKNVYGINSQLPVYTDRVICRMNNWQKEVDGLSLANGLPGTVVNQPDISTFNGKSFIMDFVPDLSDIVFRNLECDFQYLMSDISERKLLKNRGLMNGNKFEYAYAITTHLSQGSQYVKGIYYMENMNPREKKNLDYTAITRFSKYCTVVIPHKKFY